MQCVISNTPLRPGPFEEDLGQQLSRTHMDRDAWELLKKYQAGEELLEVYTTLETYTNMQISNISTTRTAKTGASLTFSVTLQEVRLATDKKGEALQLKVRNPKSVRKSTKGGLAKKQPNAKATEKVKEKPESFFTTLGEFFLGGAG